jgi:metallo-beta-lactamase class B
MQKSLAILIAVFIELNCTAQTDNKIIKISDDLQLVALTENTWLHVSYVNMPGIGRVSANGLIYINGTEAFLFDTPWNDAMTRSLVNWLRDTMKLKITGFIPNHWHNDCMGGLAYLQGQKIDSYSNWLTAVIAGSKNLPVPAHTFRDSLQLTLGDKHIYCYYPGPAHTTDNIVVWIPAEKILFAGCMVKSYDATDLGNTADGNLKAYPGTIEKVIKKFPEAEIVIPGHGKPGGKELLVHTLSLARK